MTKIQSIKIKTLITISICLLIVLWVTGQQSDTATVRSLTIHSFQLLEAGKYDSVKFLNDSAVAVTLRSGDSNGYAYAQFIRGTLAIQQISYDDAQLSFLAAQHWFKQHDASNMYAKTNARLATLAGIREDYAASLKLYYEALPGIKLSKDTSLIITTLNNIATVHFLQGSYDDALKLYHESLQLAGLKDVQSEIAKNNSDIGGVYFRLGNYQEAEKYCSIALNTYSAIQDDWGIAYATSVLGNIYEKQGEILLLKEPALSKIKLQDALRMYHQMRQLTVAIKDIDGMAEADLYIGNVFVVMHKDDSARYYLRSCLRQAFLINKKQYIRDAYRGLYRTDSAGLEYKSALRNFEQFILYRDSIVNEESLRKSDQHKANYEIALRENEIKLLSAENDLKTSLTQKESQRKNFALAGIALVVIIGGYAFYRFRKKKQIQNEQNLQNERLRISRELHDEVGATLSGVAMYSHLTKTQLQSQDLAGVENSLAIMQDSSAQMVNKLNDIVWLINPDKSSLPGLMQRLEEYARKMAAAKNMEVRATISETIYQHLLTMEQRRNIYLFCKEAINNAVKYSEAIMLELSVTQKEDVLEFIVSDNGKGFDLKTIKRGNGLNNLLQRAAESGAECFVQTGYGKGCTVSMQLTINS